MTLPSSRNSFIERSSCPNPGGEQSVQEYIHGDAQVAIGESEVSRFRIASLVGYGLRAIGVTILAIVLLLSLLGAIGHVARLNAEPPFQLVEVEVDRRLHVRCEGQNGAPFVLYDAGAFGIYADGWWIKEALKADYPVCIYDRAGMGWSDPVPTDTAPTPAWHVEDIRRLRAALGETTPFILVGHSMAGLRLHAYANTYPDELAGLVFVDAARPQRLEDSRMASLVPWFGRIMSIGGVLARTGIAGGGAFLLPDELDLPEQQAQDKRRSIAAVSHHSAARSEVLAAFGSDYAGSQPDTTPAGNLPVVVYSTSEDGGANRTAAQSASSKAGFGRIRGMPEESHVSLLDRQSAELIAADIRDMSAHLSKP